MNSSKLIDISKSSLIGLKAELLKKQEEVKHIKELQKDCVKQQQKRISGSNKSNKGVEKRNIKDNEQTEDDFDVLRKSRELLEAKARLYDKLKGNEGDGGSKTQYLIDFDLKQEIYSKKTNQNVVEQDNSELSEDENAYSDSNSDPENDWVDFMDTLGRSRRCLRKDLPEMKAKDENLAASLRPPTPPPVVEASPELLSWDMQRELMRKKWEEQETLLLDKKDVHYQDVLFDEARPHGVGYFGFSTDEGERQRQQQELKNIRKETMEQQDAAVGLRVRRQQQLEARLAAARRRKRERLGLPPEEPQVAEANSTVDSTAEPVEEVKEERIEDLEESIKKIAPVRPWDIGKQGATYVMSQEEWVETKRSERPQEFAPPSSLEEPAEGATPGLKKINSYKMNFNKAESGSILSNRDSYNNNAEETSYKSSSGFSKTTNNLLSSDLDKTTSYRPSFGRPCQNDSSKNSVTNSKTLCSTITNRKPTSEDIDILLSKSKEKHYHNRETKNTINSSVATNTVSENNERFNAFVNSSKVAENKTTNIINKTNSGVQKFVSEIVDKTNKELIKSERESTTNESYSKGKTIEDSIDDICDKSMYRNKNNANKRKWAEIPPPTSMSYYMDGVSSSKQHTSNKSVLSESISVGLNFLKSKEKKESKMKGLLDII